MHRLYRHRPACRRRHRGSSPACPCLAPTQNLVAPRCQLHWGRSHSPGKQQICRPPWTPAASPGARRQLDQPHSGRWECGPQPPMVRAAPAAGRPREVGGDARRHTHLGISIDLSTCQAQVLLIHHRDVDPP
eukprot:scaffold1179_cov118-Isochrysis_galbana.AAC.13